MEVNDKHITASTKKRKWWLALLINFFIPGLGQVYNGQMKKGIFFSVLFGNTIYPFLLVFILVRIKLPYPFNLIIVILFVIYIYIDVIKNALSQRKGYVLKQYNRWYFYLIYTVLFLTLTINVRTYVGEMYKIRYVDKESWMANTILRGDWFLLDKLTYKYNSPKAGDIIIHKGPGNLNYINRCIATEGATVKIIDKYLYVNDKLKIEPYVKFVNAETNRNNYGPVLIPVGHIFVLGDNRDISREDSRYWGLVSIKNVIGQAKLIYYSFDYEANRIRWKRIYQYIQN
jgi:signal peptidase I